MVLPLIEYHDPIGDAFTSTSAVHLAAAGNLTRSVNPVRGITDAVPAAARPGGNSP